MLVRTILDATKHEAVTVGPEDTVAETARRIAEKRRGLAVVCDADKALLGIISVIDINRALAQHAERAAAMRAREVMSTKIAVCAPGDTVEQALDNMTANHVRHLPVVDKGVLLGVINIGDLLHSRFEEARVTADDMRRYFFGAGYH